MKSRRTNPKGYILLITMLLLVALTFMGLVAIQISGLEMQMAINEDINQECKACADGFQRYFLSQLLKGPQYIPSLPTGSPLEYPCSPRLTFVYGQHVGGEVIDPSRSSEGLGEFQTTYGWQRSGVLGRNWGGTVTYGFLGAVKRAADGRLICEVLIRMTL